MDTTTQPEFKAPARRLIAAVSDVDTAVRQGRPADVCLSELFRAHRNYGSKTRRLIGNTLFSFFRWRGWLLSHDAPATPRAIALAHALDATVLEQTVVDMAALLNPPFKLTPMGTASLLEKGKQLADLTGNVAPTYTTLVPAWVPATLAVPPDGREDDYRARCIESLQSRPPAWLRFRAGEREKGIHDLNGLGYDVRPHAVLPGAAVAATAISREHAQHRRTTPFEFQDLSSQCVGQVAAPQPGEVWWDACTGSGGKALQLADLMQGRGTVWATDTRSGSLRQLERRAARSSVRNSIRIHEADARSWRPSHPVDGVLVDAPCSGLGTWGRCPDARWRSAHEQISDLSRLQHQLLNETARHVKPGGALVYAVCTLTQEETEDHVSRFLMDHPDFEPDEFQHPLVKKLVTGRIFIHAWDGPCDWMFIARWKKRAP